MSKIFKPRRGKASTMNGTKSSTVLAAGEMFIELPDTGVGTGICKMKMGDGVTAYSSLPYAMGGDIASTEITGSIVEDTSATATAALANVTTGRTLGAIIGSLRRACQLNASAIATLNDENSFSNIEISGNIKGFSSGSTWIIDYKKFFILTCRDLLLSTNIDNDLFHTPIHSNYRPTKDISFTGIFVQQQTTVKIVQIWTRNSGIFGCSSIVSGITLNGSMIYL